MKITGLKTFVIDCFRTNWVFVKVMTDEGISGIGEGTLEYKENALVGAIQDLEHALVGKEVPRGGAVLCELLVRGREGTRGIRGEGDGCRGEGLQGTQVGSVRQELPSASRRSRSWTRSNSGPATTCSPIPRMRADSPR